MNWQSVVVDVAVLAAVVTLAALRLISPEVTVGTISALIAARAALAKPPGPGDGSTPALAASGAAAVVLGFASLLRGGRA